MKISIPHQKIRPAEIATQIQAVVSGFVISETWFFSQETASKINSYISVSALEGIALAACSVAMAITVFYVFFRNAVSDIDWLWRGNRASLLGLGVLGVFGIFTSAIVGGVGTGKYQELIEKVATPQLLLLTSIPLLIALLFVLKSAFRRDRKQRPPPFFLNDEPIKSKEEDSLEVHESAKRFAEGVLNGGSLDSLVFGIDAPWGIGKSSFIYFCCDYWQHTVRPQPIVLHFEPLRYINSDNLVEKFIHELIDAIHDHAFDPSLRSIFSKYLRLIKGKSEISILGIKFELEPDSSSLNGILEALKARLAELDEKIIIVIDDLDRLGWSEAKSILYAIRHSFMLPNISYVLCYDTANLASLKETYDDAEQVKEFLEKYVNVKVGLYLDSKTLARFVSFNKEDAISKNLQKEAHLLDQVRRTLNALVEIFRSNEFVFYQPFLGDIRKLKRLINTMMLFEIQTTDFSNSDYNQKDLLHLLLIYINYPTIFRTIYNAETGGKGGFFSLIRGKDRGYVNSNYYSEFVQKLNNENAKYLLDRVFNLNDALDRDEFSGGKIIDQSALMSRACFNGQSDSGHNLERYLNLIVKLSKQERRDAYQFYVGKKEELRRGTPLDKIFDSEEFNFSSGEFARNQLWMIIANSAHELPPHIGSELVLYIISKLPEYSMIENENVGSGLRTRLIYSLLKLLDEAAWGSSLSGRRNNTPENISEIAEWVFGKGRHADTGVVNTLAQPERGPLGIFDLLLFRLYCSADRGSSLFNLQRAIALHGNPAAQTTGVTTEIAKEEMREISQMVFRIFNEQYIEQGINILEAIDNLTLNDFVGASSEYVKTQIGKTFTQEQLDFLVAKEKSRAKAFIVYQLGNSMISSGVGCGYYDVSGREDKGEISIKINDYLFSQCFDPSKNQNNFELFLDYLLNNFSHTFEVVDGFHHVPTIDEFTKVIKKERLESYWKCHRATIRSLNFPAKDKSVVTANYVATYTKRLPEVYRVLDEAFPEDIETH